ncbi:MAG: CHAT domain-containing protein, partial [Symploca sp. SIO3C6]|nr:CHAT domain-containing protein [Symploca sp. SIO3C6]
DGRFQQRPLVFLNACQSAGGADALRKTFNLPQMFIERGAGAVIATACPVPDRFAAAFAQQFYHFFLAGHMTIGQALHKTRWHFLTQHHNPLGLAYGLYSPAYYRLAQSPMQTQLPM